MLKRTKRASFKRKNLPKPKITTEMMLRALAIFGTTKHKKEARHVIRQGKPYQKSYNEVGLLLKAVIEGDYSCALARSDYQNYEALIQLQYEISQSRKKFGSYVSIPSWPCCTNKEVPR